MFWRKKKDKEYNKRKERIVYLCKKRKEIMDRENLMSLTFILSNTPHFPQSRIQRILKVNENTSDNDRLFIAKHRALNHIGGKISSQVTKLFEIK